MINFKTFELEDKKTIEDCLASNVYKNCDFSFANLFAWNKLYKTVFAVEHETLFIRFQDTEGTHYYMMPIGKMPLQKAFQLMMDDAAERKIPFQMKGITIRMWNHINQVMPGMFKYSLDRDYYEYIYLSEKLTYLKGKKLQSKRNHINRFKADNPDWSYSCITEQREIEECKEMLDEWEGLNSEKKDLTLRHEYLAVKTMLDNFQALQLCGGYVKVNGKIVAFSLGEPINSETFCVHVEKAFSDINGAYTIINQQFVEHCAADYKYVNREEDLGLENLRKSKLSYYPDILLEEGALEMA